MAMIRKRPLKRRVGTPKGWRACFAPAGREPASYNPERRHPETDDEFQEERSEVDFGSQEHPIDAARQESRSEIDTDSKAHSGTGAPVDRDGARRRGVARHAKSGTE